MNKKTTETRKALSRKKATSGHRVADFDAAIATPNAVEDPIRGALANELLAVCLEALRAHGLSDSELSKVITEVMSGQCRVAASNSTMDDVSSLARLVGEWTENPEYVDGSGRPRVLAIKGPDRTFASLAAKHFGARNINGIIRFAVAMKAIERVGKYSVAPLGSCVLLTGNRTLLLSHGVRAVRWLLRTNEYNSSNTRLPALPERQAFAELSEDNFSEFLDFMRGPIINLVDMGNRWLLAHSAQQSRSAADRRILMGVHAYLFRDQ